MRTKSFIAKIHRKQYEKVSQKKYREEDCALKTVRLKIRDGLSLKAYKNIWVPALTDAHIVKRKSFCIWLKNHFDRESCRSIMFFDEKWFDQVWQYNRQNDRTYAVSRQTLT